MSPLFRRGWRWEVSLLSVSLRTLISELQLISGALCDGSFSD